MEPKDNKTSEIPDLNRPNFNEEAAAFFLGVSISSLRKSRMNGGRKNYLPPPPFHKLGRRVIYVKDELQRYLSKHSCHAE